MAAATANPPDEPSRMPSSRATWRAMRKASSSLQAITSVEHRGVPGVREEVLADALDQVGPTGAAREDRALGIGGDHLDRRVHPLEVAGRRR